MPRHETTLTWSIRLDISQEETEIEQSTIAAGVKKDEEKRCYKNLEIIRLDCGLSE